MANAGQILYHKNFIFKDGKKGDKYVIVLNTCENDKTCLVLKTTSQSKYYSNALPGCNSGKCIFCIYSECEQDFEKETYVQMDYIYSINIEEQLDKQQVTWKGHLTEECFSKVRKCLRNFRDDIPQRYWTIIYSAK